MRLGSVLLYRQAAYDDMANCAPIRKKQATRYRSFNEVNNELWNEYLKLRKHCEDANFKIPFQLFESGDCNNKDISNKDVNTSSQVYCGCSIKLSDISQMMPGNTNISTSVCASAPIICSSGIVADLDDNISYDDKFVYQQRNQDRLMSSPILIKNRVKAKKNNVASSHSSQNSFSKDSDEYVAHECIPVKENLSILVNSPKKNELFNESKKDECSLFSLNESEVECTPMAKVSRELRISKLYNVDTILLKNGKKIKQSQLVFLPSEQSVENRLNPLQSHISSTPEKTTEDESKDNQSIDEEIIQGSPNKSTESNLRIKNMKVKRKIPFKTNQASTKEKNRYDREVKVPLKEKGQTILKHSLMSMCIPKQDQLSSLKKSETFRFSSDEKTGNRSDVSSEDNFEHMQKDKESQIVKNIDQTEKESIDEKANSKSSICDDETFCMLGEKLKEVPSCNAISQTIKENIFEDDKSSVPSPVRRSLINSFDMPYKRKNTEIDQPSKKRSDREKMTGVTCWECKKYYENLGLSEKEIKARQNQCSRHRIVQKKREDTPEGFWNPIFSGTYSSTFQDD